MLVHLALPVLVAAILVFVSSSLIHMVFKWHNSDYGKLADEDAVRAALRASVSKPGQYVIPYCLGMKEMQSPEMQAKWVEGPVGFIHVRPNGIPKMGPTLGQWFVLNVVVAALVAHVACSAVGITGVNSHHLFHVTALTTFLAYGVGSLTSGIWKGQTWGSVAKDLLDALIYGLVSGAAFAWQWPS
ncbi:MAG: hypothetical protein JWQ90_2908 [Hydrocarboniphaga sp.]|uniref:hypothetical protein n=1 Tax=Hydrocarboniphaga sp. TaxID=2033016 RepID=UPI0026057F81|nr:hypothetical protein [Hydrocarboniphaga sp.]MDB5970458.1 hypothetical protein [Hydrocarboniphaga sp.]